MDSIAIIVAFALGFAARQIGLPPLVGYLVADGVHAAFIFFDEAGAGLTEAAYEKLERQTNKQA